MCAWSLLPKKRGDVQRFFTQQFVELGGLCACVRTYIRAVGPPQKKTKKNKKQKQKQKREQHEYIYTPSLNYTNVIQSKSFLNKHRIDGATNQKHGDVHTPPLPLPLRLDVQYGRLRRR